MLNKLNINNLENSNQQLDGKLKITWNYFYVYWGFSTILLRGKSNNKIQIFADEVYTSLDNLKCHT